MLNFSHIRLTRFYDRGVTLPVGDRYAVVYFFLVLLGRAQLVIDPPKSKSLFVYEHNSLGSPGKCFQIVPRSTDDFVPPPCTPHGAPRTGVGGRALRYATGF